MLEVKIEISARGQKYLRDLKKMTRKREFNAQMRKFLLLMGSRMAGHITKNTLAGQILKRRTGSLARSVASTVVYPKGSQLPGIKVGVFRGPAKKYAAVQEYGTKGRNISSPIPTIRPKRRKALTIPTRENKTAAGVAKRTAKSYRGSLKFIPFRNSGVAIGGLFAPKSYSREVKLARKSGRPVNIRNMDMLFILVKHVDLKERRWLRKGVEDFLPTLGRELTAFLKEYFRAERIASRG